MNLACEHLVVTSNLYKKKGLACQQALRRLPHTGPNGRRHHQLRPLQGRREVETYVPLLLW